MDHSKSYLALAQMIEMDWLVTSISELDHVLNELEESGQITRAEHQALLLRFMGKKVDGQDSGEESPGALPSIH